MNDRLQTIYTRKEEFVDPERFERLIEMEEIPVDQQDMTKLMEGLDVRKAVGLDRVAGWILRECAEQFSVPKYDRIKSILNETEVPLG